MSAKSSNSASSNNPTSTRHRLLIAVKFAAAALFVKIFLAILAEYPSYFPADFDANFLIGRRSYFYGVYSVAFYTHIISGPLALIGGSFLMLSGGRGRYRRVHRWVGRVQALLVLGLVTPSGLVMARYALAGGFAGMGLAVLSLATALCLGLAVYQARCRQFRSHQIWTTRAFILLSSPLLLRLISGAAIVMRLDTDWFYRLNAWLSWIVPLAIFEAWQHGSRKLASAPVVLYDPRTE